MANEPIKISMRGFAEVSATEAKRKTTVLKRFRFPKSEESVGRSNYYVKALSAIKKHHRGDTAFVNKLLQELLAEMACETDSRKRAKFANNHRAITEYLKNFGDRQLTIRPGKRLYFVSGDVVVSAQPDLVAEEAGHLKLFKLNLGKDDYAGGVNSILLHTLHEAAKSGGLALAPKDVECLQVSSGTRVVGPSSGFPPKKILESACGELSSIWPAA